MTTLSRFEIHQPSSVREASEMLTHHGDEAGFYAGGTELLLAMRHKALSYRHLIDLKVIPGLDAIRTNGDHIEIGAACTHRTVERSPVVREKLPALAELESHVANVRVRATGTLGGNLCFGEPHSDPASLLLVLEAQLTVEGASGSRELDMDHFIADAYSTNLQPGEILTKISVPLAKPAERIAYVKFQIRERPSLGLALWLETPDGGQTITAGRVAVGCVGPYPFRVRLAEDILKGSRQGVEMQLGDAAQIIADSANLLDDHEGSAAYKRHLIGVFLRRAFTRAVDGSPTA
jgi:carbon-monoxide dehydrogenase medium subunit